MEIKSIYKKNKLGAWAMFLTFVGLFSIPILLYPIAGLVAIVGLLKDDSPIMSILSLIAIPILFLVHIAMWLITLSA